MMMRWLEATALAIGGLGWLRQRWWLNTTINNNEWGNRGKCRELGNKTSFIWQMIRFNDKSSHDVDKSIILIPPLLLVLSEVKFYTWLCLRIKRQQILFNAWQETGTCHGLFSLLAWLHVTKHSRSCPACADFYTAKIDETKTKIRLVLALHLDLGVAFWKITRFLLCI